MIKYLKILTCNLKSALQKTNEDYARWAQSVSRESSDEVDFSEDFSPTFRINRRKRRGHRGGKKHRNSRNRGRGGRGRHDGPAGCPVKR